MCVCVASCVRVFSCMRTCLEQPFAPGTSDQTHLGDLSRDQPGNNKHVETLDDRVNHAIALGTGQRSPTARPCDANFAHGPCYC